MPDWLPRVVLLCVVVALWARFRRKDPAPAARSNPAPTSGPVPWLRRRSPEEVALEAEIARLGAIIDAPASTLITFDNRDGACPFVRVVDGEFHWQANERGQIVEHRVAADRDELLYWAFADTTREMAYGPAVAGEQQRVTVWRRQFELLHRLDPRWAQRQRRELAESLADPNDVALIPPLPGPS